MPRLVETGWLATQLGRPGLKVIDLRPQPEYNTAHIPGSLSLNVESLRGNIGGLPSLLLPPTMLAAQFSLLGLQPSDAVVLVSGEKFHFVLKHLLSYTNVHWYDTGWTEWATRPELPVVNKE